MDFTNIFMVAIILIYAIIAIYWVFKKPTAEQVDKINKLATMAVQAAEQLVQETGMGSVKKEMVLDFLESKGINTEDDAVDVAIEAAVYKLKNGILDVGV